MFNKSVVSFVDLDDTLFQSYRKCEGKEIVRMCAEGSTKERSSYMSVQQFKLCDMLRTFSLVIPTTARDIPSFNNVNINWDGPAILNHGGTVLLPDGTEDLEWKAKIEAQMVSVPESLDKFKAFILDLAEKEGLDIRVRLVRDSPLYLVVKHNKSDVEQLRVIKRIFEEAFLNDVINEFYIHFNDNNLAILPNCLNKVHAVRHVLKAFFDDEKITTLGVGDSLTDFDYMSECDFVISPSKSQLITAFKDNL